MNAMEREARKAELARQVLSIDNDEQLDRLDWMLREVRQEQEVNSMTFPEMQYTVAEMDNILDQTLIDIAEGKGETTEQVFKELYEWMEEEERRGKW